MTARKKFLALLLTLLLTALVVGCAGVSSERKLTLGTTGWDESVAVSDLTMVLLKDELGYDRVELKTLDVASSFESVGSGDLDAFQAVRLPNWCRGDYRHRTGRGSFEKNLRRGHPDIPPQTRVYGVERACHAL